MVDSTPSCPSKRDPHGLLSHGRDCRLRWLVLPNTCPFRPCPNYSNISKASMMNALQISPTWKAYYNYPTEGKLGAINALLPAGKICGSLIVAPFSNKFGRKLSLVLAFIVAIIGAGIQAGAVNFGMLLFSRWLLGFGAGFMSQPSPILIAELAYPTNRAKLTSLYHCFFVSVPQLTAPDKTDWVDGSMSGQSPPRGSPLALLRWMATGAGESLPSSRGPYHWCSSSSPTSYQSHLGSLFACFDHSILFA